MRDCFCGINLITSTESYSSFAVPGKFIHYLQMQIPILASKNNGFVDVLEKNKLGIVIELDTSLILSSIHKLYQDQETYITNILQYGKKYPYLSIKDYLKMIEKTNQVTSKPT